MGGVRGGGGVEGVRVDVVEACVRAGVLVGADGGAGVTE